PGTTLLITDIQDSTVIWETLPADVTDQAVKLHHEVIRQSSIAHRGYECCTEGDSFILAFHTPNDAARFAVAAQAALVLAPWPQQLYELEPVAMHEHLQRLVPVAAGPGPGRVLIFQGLRVRMGMASGTSSADEVTFNASLGRVKYGGALMAAAKAIQDAAQGGMVLATSSTFKQLSVESLGSELLVISMGEHVLKAGEEAVQVYHLLNQALSHRAFHLGAVRSVAQSSLGILQAPYGQAAVCFMNAVGVGILEAWNRTVAAAALKLYQGCAQAALCQHGGYLMEAVDGLCLAAFASPAAAMRWALDTLTRCLELDWPPELLEHELGEAVELMSVNNQGTTSVQPSARALRRANGDGPTELAGRATPPATSGRVYQLQVHKLLFRGLRVKVGIDYGPVHADLHAVTGRVTYRGKAMNRAARICGSAKSGQVWASSGAWHAAQHDLNNRMDSLSYGPGGTDQAANGMPSAAAELPVAATNLGSFKLKGIKVGATASPHSCPAQSQEW
ncbi:guanylate cyclase domain-containing protein, partial [Haematococcus lacustris]